MGYGGMGSGMGDHGGMGKLRKYLSFKPIN